MSIPVLKIYDENHNPIPIPAIKGADGKSAYESAQDGGYTGTETQFNSDLANVSAKADKPTIKTTMDAVAAVNTQYFLGTQSTVSITIPSTAGIGQEILVCFTSGSTAATLTCNLTGFSFVPKANKTSWIKFTCYNSSGDWLVETKEG